MIFLLNQSSNYSVHFHQLVERPGYRQNGQGIVIISQYGQEILLSTATKLVLRPTQPLIFPLRDMSILFLDDVEQILRMLVMAVH
jgi:hypothetical protein